MSMSTTSSTVRDGTVLASRPLMGWRTVDILTVTMLGAALGIAYFGWGQLYNGPITALKIGYAPLMGLFSGFWFLAGVVGGLIVRRPGAALLCEVVAALVSMLPGTEWGATVLISGILQGLGAELVLAAFRYQLFGRGVAMLAGAMSAPLEWLFETFSLPAGGGGWYADWPAGDKLVYLGALAVSGSLLAGLLGWLLTRSLARAGALSAFPPGQEDVESRAV